MTAKARSSPGSAFEKLRSADEALACANLELAQRAQALERANGDLRNLLESARVAMVVLDKDLRVTSYTPAVTELIHLVPADIGRPIEEIESRLICDELRDDALRVRDASGRVRREVEDPATGRRYVVCILPYRDADENGGRVAVTFTDITPLSEVQRALRESEAQANVLLAELQHRVRNTLSVVRSIARRTADNAETAEDYAAHLEGRIGAFARVQAALARNPMGGIGLSQLIADELLAYAAHEGVQVEGIEGPDVRLKAKAAETLALAVHELATNALKFGALSTRRGRVKVAWRLEPVEGSPCLVLDWRETGVQLERERPGRSGFGTELLKRNLAYELGGRTSLNFERDGLHCNIIIPAGRRLLLSPDRL